jgi:L-aminopeptidase/D-esterase-like protein
VLGGAPGTRETDALSPANLVGSVDAIVLAGGSVYGLGAADEVVAWLGARGKGYVLGGSPMVAPVVPAAILFDLTNGGNKSWGETPPYRRLAREACESASLDFAIGNVGAGLGARAGAYKGGLGSASAVTADGFSVGALIAANPFGSPVIPGTSTLWAYALEQNGELGRQRQPVIPNDGFSLDFPDDIKRALEPQNTTIGVVAVDAALTTAEAERIALMAQSGLARAVRPIHTSFDGDVIFTLATGRKELPEPRAAFVTRLGSIAADCAARAVARAVFEAKTLGPMKSYRDAHPTGFG